MAVETAAATGTQANKEQLLGLYRQMLEIRRCEEQLARLHQSGLIPGACHTYVGEEAIATAVCAHLRESDTVMSTHRGHGHALAKGVPPRELIAELLGKVTGCSHGRGGSMHLFKPEVGMLGTSGIVGPSILMAAGAGYTYMLKQSDQVAVAFFGDGATNNGSPSVAAKGASYGINAVELDRNDVLAIYQAAGEAVRRARAGGGPTLLECKTYRTRPHSEGMRDAGYRTPEEVETWRTRDPIPRLRNHLLAEEIATEDDLAQIDRAVQELIAEAAEFAKASPWPDAATATDHVFSSR